MTSFIHGNSLSSRPRERTVKSDVCETGLLTSMASVAAAAAAALSSSSSNVMYAGVVAGSCLDDFSVPTSSRHLRLSHQKQDLLPLDR